MTFDGRDHLLRVPVPPFGALEQLGGGSLTLNWIEEALVLPRDIS